jgi:hypothetical protein
MPTVFWGVKGVVDSEFRTFGTAILTLSGIEEHWEN